MCMLLYRGLPFDTKMRFGFRDATRFVEVRFIRVWRLVGVLLTFHTVSFSVCFPKHNRYVIRTFEIRYDHAWPLVAACCMFTI